jgi:hypothetical protein
MSRESGGAGPRESFEPRAPARGRSRTRLASVLFIGVVGLLASGACSGKSERNEQPPAASGRAGAGSGGITGLGGEAGQGTGGTGGSGGNAGGGAGMTGKAGAGGGAGSAGSTGGTDTCVPTTCEAEGMECGALDDGCGRVVECGSCDGGCTCNDEGQCDAGPPQSVERSSAKAVSSGFSGTEAEYTALYSMPCSSEADCITPCIASGGTDEMCAAGMCVDSDPNDACLPSTIWTELDQLATEGSFSIDCAELVLWSDPYLDYLFLTDFGFEIPAAAEILGVSVRVRRAGGSNDEAADAGVHLIKASVVGDADRSNPGPWPGPELAEVTYGGPADLWDEELTPEDVNSPEFGVALAAEFTQGVGSGRAYIDIVYVTVHYHVECSGDS